MPLIVLIKSKRFCLNVGNFINKIIRIIIDKRIAMTVLVNGFNLKYDLGISIR